MTTCRVLRRSGLLTDAFRNGAYTFLELALAMAIVAIVFAAVIPLFTTSLSERRLRGGMHEIEEFVRGERLAAEKLHLSRDILIGPEELRGSDGVSRKGAGEIFVRFPEGKWERGRDQHWSIFACGIVAPASIRMQQGAYWIESDFDPLTGGIAEERYSF